MDQILHETKLRLMLKKYTDGINDLNDSTTGQLCSLNLDDLCKRNIHELKDGMSKSRER